MNVLNAERHDATTIYIANKRGCFPMNELAPRVPLSEWLRPTESVKALSNLLKHHSESSGPCDFRNWAFFVHNTIQDIVTPTADPASDDFWNFPDETLRALEGDCEDVALLVSSLLLCHACEHSIAFTVLGKVAVGDDSFPHAWVQLVRDDGNFEILDYHLSGDNANDIAQYTAFAAFNNRVFYKYVSNSIEDILSRSYAWGWKPPRIRLPTPSLPNPLEAAKKKLQNFANSSALSYRAARGGNGDYEDCVAVVAAACAAYGASQGGVVGAAIGAGGGVPFARIACRRAFP